MHWAMNVPTSHAQTVDAGPPMPSGLPNVAGTEPRTPRTETAYDSVDQRLKWRRRSLEGSEWPGGPRTYLSIANPVEHPLIVVRDGGSGGVGSCEGRFLI